MKKVSIRPAVSLPDLCHHRWTIPTLATLHRLDGGAKFITLQRALGTGRDSLQRTLEALLAAGLAVRNPGYGHPMRPEYLLTAAGRRLAPACARLVERLGRLGIMEPALNKWSLPLVHALASTDGRFNALMREIRGVTPRALTAALRDAAAANLIVRRVVDDQPPRSAYALTENGREVLGLLKKMARIARSRSGPSGLQAF